MKAMKEQWPSHPLLSKHIEALAFPQTVSVRKV